MGNITDAFTTHEYERPQPSTERMISVFHNGSFNAVLSVLVPFHITIFGFGHS